MSTLTFEPTLRPYPSNVAGPLVLETATLPIVPWPNFPPPIIFKPFAEWWTSVGFELDSMEWKPDTLDHKYY